MNCCRSFPGFGLSLLPEPSPGDIFFDFEGDPFVGEGGLEFCSAMPSWARTERTYAPRTGPSRRADEKSAFERFVDFVMARLRDYPDLHIYHFAPYEPGALKRLMGRYATRENEIDFCCAAECFIDLYTVVRHGIRASLESYSIKKLEAALRVRPTGAARSKRRSREFRPASSSAIPD